MTASWVEVVVSVDGATMLDGKPVEGFGTAIERIAAVAAAGGSPVLVRSEDRSTGMDPMWFLVDAAGQLTVTSAPAEAPSDETPEIPLSAPFTPPSAMTEPSPEVAAEREMPDELIANAGVEGVSAAPAGARASLRVSRRSLLIGGACTVGVLALGGAVWGVTALAGSAAAAPSPVISVAPAEARVVTLPGFADEPVWTASKTSAAAVSENRVISVSGSTVSVRDAATGEPAAVATIAGDRVAAISGRVAGAPAVAAVSESEALVWVGDAIEPLAVDLSGGRRLVQRAGSLFVAGAGYSFDLVTATGTVPVTSPRPEMIVLGAEGDAVIWAGAPRQVIVASTNGTPVREVTLAAPVEGAAITPKVGWVRAATAATVVVGWTTPGGETTTGVHASETGELVAQIPGPGNGVSGPAGEQWVTDGHLIDLTASTTTPLPDGFTASQFLGDQLYGALLSGRNALYRVGDSAPVEIDAPTERPIGVASGVLLTMTNGVLAAYLAAK